MGRSQISVFIIIGLVLISITGLFLLVNKNIDTDQSVDDLLPLNTFIYECIKLTAEDAVFVAGTQGGVDTTNEINGYELTVPFYVYLDSMSIPTKTEIEKFLSEYMQENTMTCLNNLEAFQYMGYNISTENLTADVRIAQEKVIFNIDYPVFVVTERSSSVLDSFSYEVDIALGNIYDIVVQIMNKQDELGDNIPLGIISTLAFSKSFDFKLVELSEDIILYVLEFENSVKSGPYYYAFMAKYNWTASRQETPIQIDNIPEFNISEPGLFNYRVRAKGNNMSFSDNTSLFQIGEKTGIIEFDTSELSHGKNDFFITAIDNTGSTDIAVLRINTNFSLGIPVLDSIGEINGTVGEELQYKVNATNPVNSTLFFYSTTTLFDINPLTGEIRFTPQISGEFTIYIKAFNVMGTATEKMKLVIT